MKVAILLIMFYTVCCPDWQIIGFGPVTGQIVCDTRDGEFV